MKTIVFLGEIISFENDTFDETKISRIKVLEEFDDSEINTNNMKNDIEFNKCIIEGKTTDKSIFRAVFIF